MKKLAFALVILALIVAFSPAAAAGPNVPVGERIIINDSEVTELEFPAGTPFHIMHGWQLGPWGNYDKEVPTYYRSCPHGLATFELDVDGVRQDPGFLLTEMQRWDRAPMPTQYRLFNFPEGMVGTHIFTGHWILECQGTQNIDPACAPLDLTNTVTITFE